MCTKIGVDPLASSKGFWSELLGVGDFYFELGVQIIDVCLELREKTGGFVEIKELLKRLEVKRGGSSSKTSGISEQVHTSFATSDSYNI